MSIDVIELTLRTGFEVELLAPAGADRSALAAEIAARCGGQVRRSFHTDSEPAAVPGVGLFRHLSPAFDVVDGHGRPVTRLVDDITIEAEEIIKMRARLIREISVETGQPYEKVVADTERNFWMGAEDAVKYGLAAKVISSASEV